MKIDLDKMQDKDSESNESESKEAVSSLEEQTELLSRAKELFSQAISGWSDIHTQGLGDISFFNNSQWDDDLLTLARAKKEPVLTVNMLPQFVKQIENELANREMSINFNATDEDGSPETATILTNLTRSIEQKSNAKSHYLYAAGENGAMVPGWGFLKVILNYESNKPGDFNQEPAIRSIKDVFKCVCDPSFQEPDASDANYWFEWEDYPVEVFRQNWPGAQAVSWTSDDSLFATDKTVRVVRFWWKEEKSTTYFLTADEEGNASELVAEHSIDSIIDVDDEPGKRYAILKDGTKTILLRRRVVDSCCIHWADFSGSQVLDQGEWVGSKFPYVLVSGVMTQYAGNKGLRGMIHFAKDSQKMLNYMASSAARRIGSANKSPWIVDMSSIAPYKKVWDKANYNNAPYLPYNSRSADKANESLPPPVRADQTGQIGDLLQAAQKFENDLQRTLGIYDAGLGASPNSQSGVAIKTLAQQGQNANSHFSMNLVRSLHQVGEILADLYPKVYDTARVIRIVGGDNKAKIVKINEMFTENGQQKTYNLSAGTYGVTINVGPAHATAKQAAIEQLLQLASTNPGLMPYIQDIIARNMDFDGKEELVDRLIKMLAKNAPELIEGTPQADIPPAALAAMEQMKVVIDQLTLELNTTTEQLQKLAQEKQANVYNHQANMQLQEKKTQDALLLKQVEIQSQQQQEELRAKRDLLNDTATKEIQEIKARVQHSEAIMKMAVELFKQKGKGSEVLDMLEPKPVNSMGVNVDIIE